MGQRPAKAPARQRRTGALLAFPKGEEKTSFPGMAGDLIFIMNETGRAEGKNLRKGCHDPYEKAAVTGLPTTATAGGPKKLKTDRGAKTP